MHDDPETMTEPRREAPAAADNMALREQLLAHPGFLLDDADLMRALLDKVASQAGNNVASLQSAMIRRLESRLAELAEAQAELIENARINMDGLAQVHEAILTMLDASSFRGFLRVVEEEFADLLDVDTARLLVEATPGVARSLDAPAPMLPGTVDIVMGDAPEVALGLARAEVSALHGRRPGGAPPIRSEALIRLDLGPEFRPGLMLFGSYHADRFDEEDGIELLAFLGGAMARAMRRWLDATPTA